MRGKPRSVHCDDAHVFPAGRSGHSTESPTSCRCEPVVKYIEKTAEGFIWRRVLVHGRLSR